MIRKIRRLWLRFSLWLYLKDKDPNICCCGERMNSRYKSCNATCRSAVEYYRTGAFLKFDHNVCNMGESITHVWRKK